MFEKSEIWVYPTDTSFGLGARADDPEMLDELYEIKKRGAGKYFSLMVRDFEMLQQFAEVPRGIDTSFFEKTPKTAILRPTKKLPRSKYWPEEKVAFRICTIPEIAKSIEFPVTATSANISGESPIFELQELKNCFGDSVKIYDKISKLEKKEPSKILDFTSSERPKRIR